MKLIVDLRKVLRQVYFIDDIHAYIDMDDPTKKYLSVSGFAKKVREPFHREYWLLYKALEASGYNIRKGRVNDYYSIDNRMVRMVDANKLKMTVTPEMLSAEWDNKKETGTRIGTAIHKIYEDNWKGKRHGAKYDVIYNFTKDNPHIIAVDTEIIVGSREINMFGQIDVLTMNLKTKQYEIRDLKTDEEIKERNPYQKMLGPFKHMEDSTLNEYFLKINLYRFLLEHCTDIKVGAMYIDHINKYTFDHKIIEIPKIELTNDLIRRVINSEGFTK